MYGQDLKRRIMTEDEIIQRFNQMDRLLGKIESKLDTLAKNY